MTLVRPALMVWVPVSHHQGGGVYVDCSGLGAIACQHPAFRGAKDWVRLGEILLDFDTNTVIQWRRRKKAPCIYCKGLFLAPYGRIELPLTV